MRVSPRGATRARTMAVFAFAAAGLLVLGVLLVQVGAPVPGVTGRIYHVWARFHDGDNVVAQGSVEEAGVIVGKVLHIRQNVGRYAEADLSLTSNAPLHQGATVQLRPKTLIGETYVQVTDGTGPPIPSGTTLPASATKGEASLNDVLNSLRPPTRQAAARLIVALRASTAGRGHDLNQLMASLGTLGRQGQTVLSVLANQNQDLSQLVRQTGTLMGALDEGQGQIADLSQAAEQVTRAAAGSSSALRHTMEDLPPLVDTARSATASVATLSGSLAPIAANLRAAAPDLNYDLVHLRPETARLRALLPALNGSLAEAPATLGPLPTTATDLTRALPTSAYLLAQSDPVLGYLAPYRGDLAAFFANFAAATGHTMPGYPGYFGMVVAIPNRSSVQGVPGSNPGDPFLPFGNAAGGNVVTNNNNPYPAPGFSGSPPRPFTGRYPRVRAEPHGAG